MKKRISLAMAVIIIVGLLAACGSKSPEWVNEEEIVTKTKEVIGLVNDKDTETIRALFRDDLKEQVTDEALNAGYDILEKVGEFKEFGEYKIRGMKVKNEEIATIVYKVKYAEKEITYNIAFDKDMNLVTLVFK